MTRIGLRDDAHSILAPDDRRGATPSRWRSIHQRRKGTSDGYPGSEIPGAQMSILELNGVARVSCEARDRRHEKEEKNDC
jgi:hypothetical protein